MSERVELIVENHVARVVLNRPDKRNGLDLAMFEALVAAGESVGERSDVRAVVLHGNGLAFCAGLDFAWFMGHPAEGQRLLARTEDSPANLAQRVAWIWQELPMPVIAALHGPVFGGGLQIALGADIRYAAPDARLSVMEVSWGLVPDMSISQTLLRVVSADVAKELVFTARILSGTEAGGVGLVTRVCDDPLAQALDTARSIAQRSPDAVRAAKRLLNQAPHLQLAEGLALETELQLALLGSRNQTEAVQANMQKRPPVFHDPE